MVGVDTQVFHGFLHCGAVGAITGIGNCLAEPSITAWSTVPACHDGGQRRRVVSRKSWTALIVLSNFDEGPDLVLYYKYLLLLSGDPDYEYHFNESDGLSPSQRRFVEGQLNLFLSWWENWSGKSYGL